MGRIRGLFCSFCLDDRVDHTNGEAAFDQSIDVSHLATPHVTSSPTVNPDRSITPLASENSTEDRYSNNFESQQPSNTNSYSLASPLQHNHYQQSQSSSNQNGHPVEDMVSHIRSGPVQQGTSPSRQSSPPCAPNIYAAQNDRNEPEIINIASQHNQQRPQARDHSNNQQPPPPPPPPVIARNPLPSTSNGTTTKLSYDIISVREPLAKILAERQQLLQLQQQQRQILGDHEYIEVYGERGSSCFYEEIAGSVSSSATYDQIGAVSNHNYQVLINAYSVANRQHPPQIPPNYDPNNLEQNAANSSRASNGSSETNNNQDHANAYDTTDHPSASVDGLSSNARLSDSHKGEHSPSTSANKINNVNDVENVQPTQSIPVYSVINKATRRGNPMMRAAFNENRPPKPPPKNIFVSRQDPSSSAINQEESSNISKQDINPKSWNMMSQIPSTSSYLDKYQITDTTDSPGCSHLNNRLPQPPPRHSKNNALTHTTDRPLPSPNSNSDKMNNNNSRVVDQNMLSREDDIESINNGYELLRSNLEDDQIDVGYEKIRESNRYSGGSISSQFYSRQLLDNGGYESVQPIYSSPSNCYEVLNPATASEIAAAAAAKLNVLEKFLNKE